MRRCRRIAAIGAVAAIGAASADAAVAQLPLIEPGPPPKARIAFVAAGSIHTIAADGSDRRLVASSPGDQFDADPAWAPNGGPIAFTRSAEGEDGVRVWLVQPDGSGLRPLVAEPRRGRGEFAPAWAPDGSRIAFARIRLGRERIVTSIVTAAADGTDQRTVYSEAGDDEDDDVAFLYSPAWSPDGQQILFWRSREGLVGSGGAPSLHVVAAAGARPRLLARNAREGAWSPDGARIAFAGVRAGSACEGDCEFAGDIHVMNADGSGSTRLMKTRADDDAPSWSGDGQWIAFHSDRNAVGSDLEERPTELYAIRPDGSCLTWLTNGTAVSRSPAYEPDAGLSADPGGCGPGPRDPLVETDTRKAESFTGFPIWWLGRIAPNGLLLTGSDVEGDDVSFSYEDCGRFDPKECGAPLFIDNADLCAGGRPLRYAGQRGWSLRLARGALLAEWREKGFGGFELFTGRTWLGITTDVGGPTAATAVDGLRRMGQEHAPGSAIPSARLPRSFWGQLTRVTAAHRRLKDVDAVAERLTLSRAEVKRRLTLARQLAELGVKRRLGCGG